MAQFTIGLDLAKSVFQAHVTDIAGKVVVARQLRRNQVIDFFRKQAPSLIGMEACATAHYWARQLIALGHEVRLLPAQAVKAYVKPGKKNDAADAAAICEAVNRPHIHAVPVKTVEQQAVLVLHRSRALLVDQRTALANALRAHMAEFGIIAAKGMTKMTGLAALLDTEDSGIPAMARPALKLLASQIDECNSRIDTIELDIAAWHKSNETSSNLATIPGIGVLTASAIAATMPDASGFVSGRQFAAWIGLVPRQNSSGGKNRLGSITKAGDQYLRKLLVLGATAVIFHAGKKGAPGWLTSLLARKPKKLAAVALANKMARIAWAVMIKGEIYSAPPRIAAVTA
jgi:transposase